MGGQGGGVLADWIVDMAEHAGWWAQTTSVPGVAQRTGATIYYLELLPEADVERAGRAPAGLMPTPGDVDLVVAAELMEGGRAIQRGLVTPDRSVLITSSHRSYAVARNPRPATASPIRTRCWRPAAPPPSASCASTCRTWPTAPAASSAPAWARSPAAAPCPSRDDFEATVRRAGLGVDASLRAFALGFDAAAQAPEQPAPIDLSRPCRPRRNRPPARAPSRCWT